MMHGTLNQTDYLKHILKYLQKREGKRGRERDICDPELFGKPQTLI